MTIHGYLLLGEHKMSKSLGNVIEPFQVADVYGPTRCASTSSAR